MRMVVVVMVRPISVLFSDFDLLSGSPLLLRYPYTYFDILILTTGVTAVSAATSSCNRKTHFQ